MARACLVVHLLSLLAVLMERVKSRKMRRELVVSYFIELLPLCCRLQSILTFLGRPRRAAATNHGLNGWGAKGGRHIEGYNNVDEMTSDDEDDASEQDYGDDEEEDEHVSLASDVDDPDDLTDVDEDEEVDDGEKKHLIVKLPVKTPTPERKTTIKLRMSPDKDSKPLGLAPNTNQGQASTSTVQPESSAVEAKENTKPASSPASNQISAHPYGTPAKPMNIPPKSPPHQNPMSPLAFRGSPEKPSSPFPKSIDVGYRGS
jgi:hypothetical protein